MRQSALPALLRAALPALDNNAQREGLLDTPRRWAEYLISVTTPKDFKFTTFDAEGYDQMVVQKNIPFYSMCEHHLAPFFGVATVAYIPNKKIVGLSKLARAVEHFASRLQNQERITEEVAKFLYERLQPKGVGVMLRARHLCMEMRGVKKPGTETATCSLLGCFKKLEVKAEFMQWTKE